MEIIAKIATVYLSGYASEDSSKNLRIKVGPDASEGDVRQIVKQTTGQWPYFGIAHWSNVYAPAEPVSEEYARAMSFKDNS